MGNVNVTTVCREICDLTFQVCYDSLTILINFLTTEILYYGNENINTK